MYTVTLKDTIVYLQMIKQSACEFNFTKKKETPYMKVDLQYVGMRGKQMWNDHMKLLIVLLGKKETARG